MYYWNYNTKLKKLRKIYNIPPAPFKGGADLWIYIGLLLMLTSCSNTQQHNNQIEGTELEIIVGAERTKEYFPFLVEKKNRYCS